MIVATAGMTDAVGTAELAARDEEAGRARAGLDQRIDSSQRATGFGSTPVAMADAPDGIPQGAERFRLIQPINY